ncbi:ArsR/SmtB family transcription factor [Limnobacter sp.]|uniref:ArsR/SmtB family transcription factor n=1 Tax=Limnobacter sp. TaxID=2003368 RepID=UPI003510ED58
MEEKDIIKALSALAQPSRLRVFRALVQAGPLGLTPGQLCETLEVPPATMSFHLKELTNAQLALPVREGRNLFYTAQFAHMNNVVAYLTENCCQGQPCGPTNQPSKTVCS